MMFKVRGDKKMNKAQNINMAKETLHILRVGFYISENNNVVNIKDQIEASIKNSILYEPDSEIEHINLGEDGNNPDFDTKIEVTDESTLSAAFRLKKEGYNKVALLNFASAKNPGSEFEKGTDSQESRLCRSSALYPCLKQFDKMYKHNIKLHNGVYSNYMIFSKSVPVFRNAEEGTLLDTPYFISMISAPPVNAGQIIDNKGEEAKGIINEAMIIRIEKILAVALLNKQEALVLGAFGVGFQRNKAQDVAEYFRLLIREDKRYNRAFKKIVFAVFDESTNNEIINAFKDKLLG
jgi:uncharacterized protein (TIGR02452 family)